MDVLDRIQALLFCSYSIIIKTQMGSCASGPPNKVRRDLPLTFEAKNQTGKPFSTIQNEFQFTLANVTIVPVQSTKISLTFFIENVVTIDLPKSAMTVQTYLHSQPVDEPQKFELKWSQVNSAQFTFDEAQLACKYLSVRMSYDKKIPIEIVKISLYQIVHGPFHHNIQIPLQEETFRLLFNAKISHIFEANLSIRELTLNTFSKVNASSCHFTIKALNQEETVADSQPSYALKSSMSTIFQESQPFFREERPKVSKLKVHHAVSTEETKSFSLCWREVEAKTPAFHNSMPSLTFDISAHEITHYFLQFIVWAENKRQNTALYICQGKIPLWKLLEKESAVIKLNHPFNDHNVGAVEVDERNIRLVQKVYSHQDYIGNCEISIDLKNEKLIEQTKYCSRTEEGIVNMRPATISTNVKSNSRTIHELWKFSDEIDQIFKKVSQKNSVDRYESQISDILNKINQKLTTLMNEVLYSDANKNEALMNNQKIFIEMLQRLYPFIENIENPVLSELSWTIILNILKRSQFSLQNLGLKGKYQTEQARQNLKRKKYIGLNYLQLLCKLLIYALKGYGSYQNDTNMISYFLAFAFFRIPSFRDYFFQVIEYEENYSKMEEKLLVFQREIEPKTSFSSSFAEIKGDWTSHFYDELVNEPRSKDLFNSLRANYKSKRWFMEISYKDEVFYDFISLLFETLSKDSAEKSDKWKYIEGYSKIVAIIMSELKQKDVTKYNLGLIRSSIELLENEHLLTPMLPLICDKTNVYDGDKVQIVLDLLDEYLQMVTKKKTTPLPNTFNQNYFFKIIRVIIQGQHYNSINRLLIVIYNYFQFFNSSTRYQIAMYLMGKVFFKLYYHWSKQIRNTFYIFLQIRIKHINHQKASEITSQLIKAIGAVKIIQKIHNSKHKQPHFTTETVLYKKLKAKLYEKYKRKKSLASSIVTNSKSDYALENILKLIDDDSSMQEHLPAIKKHSYVEKTPTKPSRPQSDDMLQLPGIKGRSYSENIHSVEQITLCTNAQFGFTPQESAQITKNENKHELSIRKKRRPSVFIENTISPVGQHQLYTSKITNELHELSELTDNQIKNIGQAKAQMLEVIESISKYANSHGGVLPMNQFLYIKANEIRE